MTRRDLSLSLVTQLLNRSIIESEQTVLDTSGSYESLAATVLQPSDSIVTFNWDTLLDRHLSGYSNIGDGFSSIGGPFLEYLKLCTAEWENTIDGNDIRRPYAASGFESYLKNTFRSTYIKLHGSVDVVCCKNERCRLFEKPLRAGPWTTHLRCGECFESVQPYLIPPLLNKPVRGNPYVQRSWTRAKEIFSDADRICIWGYSLPPTDYWANWLIQNAWRGRCEKLVVINPDAFLKSENFNKTFINRFLPPLRKEKAQISVHACSTFSDFVAGNIRELAK